MTTKFRPAHPLAYATEERSRVDHSGDLLLSWDYLKRPGGHVSSIVSLVYVLKLGEPDGEQSCVRTKCSQGACWCLMKSPPMLHLQFKICFLAQGDSKYSWLHICKTSGWCQCNSSPPWEQLWKGVLQRQNKDRDSTVHGQHSSHLILDCHSINITTWAILPAWTPAYEWKHDQNLLTTLTSCPPTTLDTLIFSREANTDCSD